MEAGGVDGWPKAVPDSSQNRGGIVVPANRSLALVLRTVDVFETSLVVTLFTRELGKVGALAKGGRRLKSPFQGGLDLLSVSDIVLLTKASESLDLLTEAASLERFACLRRDLAALYAGYYIAELLTELTDYHDPHPKLFDAARTTLRHLGDPELRTRRVLRFELACLRELGLMPALDQCAHCGAPVDSRGRGGVRPGHWRCALPILSAGTTPCDDALEHDARGYPDPGQPRTGLARAVSRTCKFEGRFRSPDRRRGHQSCPGPPPEGLALPGSVNR